MNADELKDLRERAEGGSTVACSVLGLSYFSGREVPQDYGEALHWLTLAADKGASRPLLHLGIMYEQGLNVEINFKKAGRFYQRSADRGEWLAYIHLARMFRYGKGTEASIEGALEWYEEAMAELTLDLDAGDEIHEAKEFISNHRKMKT